MTEVFGLGPIVSVIAFFYSMAGWAGGSAYAALFSSTGLEPSAVKQLSLSLNVWVASLVWIQFSRCGYFRPKMVLPFVLLSVPTAWLGMQVPLASGPFLFLIGCCLLAAASRILLMRVDDASFIRPARPSNRWLGLPVGALFGFLSGLAGIGGGIFLTPFLILTKRASFKEAAAASSFFIAVNSLAGLWAKGQMLPIPPDGCGPLVIWALLGGAAGSSVGIGWLPARLQRGVLAAFLLFFSLSALSKAWALW